MEKLKRRKEIGEKEEGEKEEAKKEGEKKKEKERKETPKSSLFLNFYSHSDFSPFLLIPLSSDLIFGSSLSFLYPFPWYLLLHPHDIRSILICRSFFSFPFKWTVWKVHPRLELSSLFHVLLEFILMEIEQNFCWMTEDEKEPREPMTEMLPAPDNGSSGPTERRRCWTMNEWMNGHSLSPMCLQASLIPIPESPWPDSSISFDPLITGYFRTLVPNQQT